MSTDLKEKVSYLDKQVQELIEISKSRNNQMESLIARFNENEETTLRLATVAEGALGSEGLLQRVKNIELTVTDLKVNSAKIARAEEDIQNLWKAISCEVKGLTASIEDKFTALNKKQDRLFRVIYLATGIVIAIPTLIGLITFIFAFASPERSSQKAIYKEDVKVIKNK